MVLTTRLNGTEMQKSALGMLMWTTPVAMMIAEIFASLPLSVSEAQKAIADLIDHHQPAPPRNPLSE